MTQRTRLIDMISSVPEHKIHSAYDQIYPILKDNLTEDEKPITIDVQLQLRKMASIYRL